MVVFKGARNPPDPAEQDRDFYGRWRDRPNPYDVRLAVLIDVCLYKRVQAHSVVVLRKAKKLRLSARRENEQKRGR